MMSLEQLQQIRARRLEKQLTEVQAKKNAMQHAEQQLQRAYQEVEQFRQWRLNHQEELFKQLTSQASGLQAMQEYRAKLEQLAQQESQLQTAIPVAQQQLQQAQQHFAAAQQVANALALKNEKTKEIVEIQTKAQAQIELSREFTQDP